MKIEAKNLRKEFSTPAEPLVVLDGMDLVIESGEAVAVTGPSGCGKSTLLHILGTLDIPTAGELLLDGSNPFQLGEAELAAFRNRSIGFVFQDHYLLPQCSVLENVVVPSLVSEVNDIPFEARARSLLTQVGLESRLTHRPSELSGGERQRAALARALLLRPGLLLCDEPTGNLDAVNSERVGDLLLDLQAAEKCTLIVVTHSAQLAGRFPRHIDLRGAPAQGN